MRNEGQGVVLGQVRVPARLNRVCPLAGVNTRLVLDRMALADPQMPKSGEARLFGYRTAKAIEITASEIANHSPRDTSDITTKQAALPSGLTRLRVRVLLSIIRVCPIPLRGSRCVCRRQKSVLGWRRHGGYDSMAFAGPRS
jgi:hypothetical protein